MDVCENRSPILITTPTTVTLMLKLLSCYLTDVVWAVPACFQEL